MTRKMFKPEKNIFMPLLLLAFIFQLSIMPGALNLSDQAQARSKSSGNEAKREIQTGLDLTGKTKTEVLPLIGGPWEKDRTPNKGRYTEKWTYSCEDERGLTSNCVFIYFSGERVKNVEIY